MSIFLDCRFKAKKVSTYLAASMTGDNMAALFKTLLDVFVPIESATITVSLMFVSNRLFSNCAFVQTNSNKPLLSTSINTLTVSVSRTRSSLLPPDSDDDNIQAGDVGDAHAQINVERTVAIARVCSCNSVNSLLFYAGNCSLFGVQEDGQSACVLEAVRRRDAKFGKVRAHHFCTDPVIVLSRKSI
jgi:hypothetical protein